MIQANYLSYRETGFFSQLMLDYLAAAEGLKGYYSTFPSLEGVTQKAKERQFDPAIRDILVDCLQNQYQRLQSAGEVDASVMHNLDKLRNEKTFTVTSGHQLCLFTGPLYFIHKLFSTINLTERLNKENPDLHFVPIYWMASEDHDFEEINHFNLFGKQLRWEKESLGPVGRLETNSLSTVGQELKTILGENENGQQLFRLFEKAYLSGLSLSEASRTLVNELFGKYGLICLDADEAKLKEVFTPYVKSELTLQRSEALIAETNSRLEQQYKIQVHPREINLFLLEDGRRERIIKEGENDFSLSDSSKKYTKSELLQLADEQPEKFSPNVVLRPLYQEVILPNLAYVGGGGEIAYWLQLKAVFDDQNIPFPVLLLRNSILWMDKTSLKKIKKNGMEISDMFLPLKDILGKYARLTTEVELDFKEEVQSIEEWYRKLIEKAKTVDNGIEGFLKAEMQKSKNMLNDLEKRLVRTVKKNNENGVNQLTTAKEKLFPDGGLQERQVNFSELYMVYGEELFTTLKKYSDPLRFEFTIITDSLE